jgi:D-alanyl-D-alanine carboxypeptidase
MTRTRTISLQPWPARWAALPFVLALICGFVAWTPRAVAQAFQTAAEEAILVDAESGTVLLEKNADQPFAPASMAKPALDALLELGTGLVRRAFASKKSEPGS